MPDRVSCERPAKRQQPTAAFPQEARRSELIQRLCIKWVKISRRFFLQRMPSLGNKIVARRKSYRVLHRQFTTQLGRPLRLKSWPSQSPCDNSLDEVTQLLKGYLIASIQRHGTVTTRITKAAPRRWQGATPTGVGASTQTSRYKFQAHQSARL
jgi:hypothetical protein